MKLEGNTKNQRVFKVHSVYGGHFEKVTGKRHRPKLCGKKMEETEVRKKLKPFRSLIYIFASQ